MAGTNASILAIVFVVHKHSVTADHCDLRLGEVLVKAGDQIGPNDLLVVIAA